MNVSDARRVPVDGNARLKRLCADAVPDGAGFKDFLSSKWRRPWQTGERRACSMTAVDRSSIRCRSTRPGDAISRARLRRLADQRRRFGYRRLHVLPRRDGHVADRRKTRPLCREENPTVLRRKSPPPDRGGTHTDPADDPPEQPRVVDLVHDRLANGRRFRVPNIIGNATRECLAAIPDISVSGKRVVRQVRAIIDRHARPGASSATTARSSPLWPSRNSLKCWISTGFISRPQGLPGTRSPKASRVGCVTNA